MLNIKLKVGEAYSFNVDGLGSAGYNWDYKVEKGFDVVKVSQQGSTVPPKPATGGMPRTFEVKLTYSIKALKPGIAEVRFFLHRVWEKDKAFLKENVLHVEVTAS